jgi:nickel and cobalt resistance protein CnrR
MGAASRNLLITLGMAVVALMVGAWVGSALLVREPRTHSLHEFVHEELDLSDTQETRLEGLEQNFAVRRKAREAELRAANAALAEAIQARHAYSPEVQAAVDRFHHTMGELQKETIVHVLEMRQVLTPAQAARYDQRIAQALTNEPR